MSTFSTESLSYEEAPVRHVHVNVNADTGEAPLEQRNVEQVPDAETPLGEDKRGDILAGNTAEESVSTLVSLPIDEMFAVLERLPRALETKYLEKDFSYDFSYVRFVEELIRQVTVGNKFSSRDQEKILSIFVDETAAGFSGFSDPDQRLRTILQSASARASDRKTIECLLRIGKATAQLQKKPWDPYLPTRSGETLMHCAASHENVTMCQCLLNEIQAAAREQGSNVRRVNPADRDDGRTPLHSAAMRGNAEIMKLLLDAMRGTGEDPNPKQGPAEATPLHEAVKSFENSHRMVSLLLEAIESRGGDVNPKDRFGDTPLHEALRMRDIAGDAKDDDNIKTIALLLDAIVRAKGDPNPSSSGQTLLHQAIENNDQPVIQLLMAAMAQRKGATEDSVTEARQLFDKIVKMPPFSRLDEPDILALMPKDGALPAPLDKLPLRFLVPFQEQILAGLAKYHPAALEAIQDKAFDGQDPTHRLATYYNLLNKPHGKKYLMVNSGFHFHEAQAFLEKEIQASEQGSETARDSLMKAARDVDREESVYLSAEALHFKSFVEQARTMAASRNLELMIVPNLTYGGTAVTPLKLHKQSGLRFAPTKQGSSDLHNKPGGLAPNLFTREQLRGLVNGRYLVVVADGSKSGHYPDAFRGYQNLVKLINRELGHQTQPGAGLDTSRFEPGPQHQDLIRCIREVIDTDHPTHQGLEVHYAALAGHDIRTSFGESPSFDWARVAGPGIICVQTTIPHEKIAAGDDPVSRRVKEIVGEKEHIQAAIDDHDTDQNPVLYLSPNGSGLNAVPPVHKAARPFYKELDRIQ